MIYGVRSYKRSVSLVDRAKAVFFGILFVVGMYMFVKIIVYAWDTQCGRIENLK